MALSSWRYQRGEWRTESLDVASVDATRGNAASLDGAGSHEPVLYTTLRTAGGKPLLAAAHQARLETSCAALQWPFPPAAADWQQLVSTEAEQSGGEIRARVSLWLNKNELQGLLECEPLQLPAQIRLWTAPVGSARPKAALKLRDPVLRDWEAQAANYGAQEAILRRGDGVITETTRSNLLWSDAAGRICYSAGPALPGVMLGWALAELRASGREIIATESSLQELSSATELFVTSAVKGPMTAVIVAGDTVSGEPPRIPAAAPGPVGKYLVQRYARLLARTAAGESICTP